MLGCSAADVLVGLNVLWDVLVEYFVRAVLSAM